MTKKTGIDTFIGRLADKTKRMATIKKMNEDAAAGCAGEDTPPERFTAYDPADSLTSEADIAFFLSDAAETNDANYRARADEVAKRARAKNQARYREALVSVIGSLRQEGIKPDAESLLELNRIVRGEITLGEAIKNIKAKLKRAL